MISEKIVRAAETLASKITGSRRNPLPQAGGVVFLLLVTLLTSGVVLFLYYSAEFKSAYVSVNRLNDETALGAIARGVHHHASGLVTMAVFYHMLRALLAGKLTGARRWAWISGAGLFMFIVSQGMTGRALPWDERSQAIIETASRVLSALPLFDEPLGRAFMLNAEISDRTAIYVLALHLVPPFAALALLGLHFHRTRRPRIWPSGPLCAAVIAGLLGAAIFDPAESLRPADFSVITGPAPFDWASMFPLALMSIVPPVYFWAGALALVTGAVSLPFVLGGAAKTGIIRIDEKICVGCGICREDCPYSAITMEPRPPQGRHPWAASLDVGLCVGCHVCIGSCGFSAIDSDQSPVGAIREKALGFLAGRHGGAAPVIVYACERALKDIGAGSGAESRDTLIIPIKCAGQLYTGWIEEDVKNGAARVVALACAPEMCDGREGAAFAGARIAHKRKPWLRKRAGIVEKAGFVTMDSGSSLGRILEAARGPGSGSGANLSAGARAHAMTAALAVLVFLAAIAFDSLWRAVPYALDDPSSARLVVSLDAAPGRRLVVETGGRAVFEKVYEGGGDSKIPVFEKIAIGPGSGDIHIMLGKQGSGDGLKAEARGPFRAGEVTVARENPKTGAMEIIGVGRGSRD